MRSFGKLSSLSGTHIQNEPKGESEKLSENFMQLFSSISHSILECAQKCWEGGREGKRLCIFFSYTINNSTQAHSKVFAENTVFFIP